MKGLGYHRAIFYPFPTSFPLATGLEEATNTLHLPNDYDGSDETHAGVGQRNFPASMLRQS
jgi:hypothetical protein